MHVVKLSALPALRVNCDVALARRLHSCTLIHLDTINGGTYHIFLSVIENSSYLPSLDVIGKATSDYRGWHKWGPPGSPADAPEPHLRPLPHLLFSCFWVEMNVTMQAGRIGKVLSDVSSALKRDDDILFDGAWRLGFLSP